MERVPSPYQLRPDRVISDRYELVRLIGEGGMGEVWEARHTQLDAPVAIKFAVERRASDLAFVQRFRREACAMAKLRSPDIVQVFDAGVFEDQPFLVMELLDGESLRALLERNSVLSLQTTATLARQMARALSVIHREGMVHRDVTPGNVFFVTPTPEFPNQRYKLLDFGIAKQIANEPRITTSGALVGSPAYMSPEQARSEVVNASSDLWSLGAVLYRCVTGEDAFQGKSVTEVLFSICTGEVPRATLANPQLPEELDGFFERAFARNPSFRFASAAEMGTAFTGIARKYPDGLEITDGNDMSSAAFLRSAPDLRTNTGTLLVTKFPCGPWIRRALRSRAAIATTALAVGALGSAVLVRGRTFAAIIAPVPKSEATAVAFHEAPPDRVGAAKGKEVASTQRAGTASSSGSVPLAPTTGITARGPTRTNVKPSAPKRPPNGDVDPIFGLPVEAK